jgi:phage gp36-like protein
MLILLAVYCFIAVFVTLAVRILDDPYEHYPTWLDWLRALLMGALWLPLALYVAGVVSYQWFKEKS